MLGGGLAKTAEIGVVDVERVTYFAATVIPDAISSGRITGTQMVTIILIHVAIGTRNGK